MIQKFCNIFAAWYCHQQGIGLAHVVSSVRQYFDADDKFIAAFEIDVLLNDPLQIKAEEALIKIIESRKAKIQLPKMMVLHAPSRRTDWAKTKIEHLCGSPDAYIASKNLVKPDVLVLGVLKNLASHWTAQLEGLPDPTAAQRERLDKLKIVCKELQSIAAQPWQPGVMAKLIRLDKRCALAIYEANNLFRCRMPSDIRLGERLQSAVTRVDQLLAARNMDALFEWYCALLIAKTATQSGWRIDSLARHITQEGRFSGIFLHRDNVVLRIAKGYPRDGNEVYLWKSLDNLGDVRNQVLSAHGINENGYQPDMVLTFWHVNDPTAVITYLADAKNGSDSYFAPAADKGIAYYFYFFDLFKQDQKPACSLFFADLDRRKYNGFDSESSLANRSHPPVIALQALDGEQAEVPAPIKYWFEYISSQAMGYLNPKPVDPLPRDGELNVPLGLT